MITMSYKVIILSQVINRSGVMVPDEV